MRKRLSLVMKHLGFIVTFDEMVGNMHTRPFRKVNGTAVDDPELIVADPRIPVPLMKLLLTCKVVLQP